MAARVRLLAAAGAFCLLAAGTGQASPCGDQIGALDARLNDTAATAGAASSGGQAVAAARGGQASETRDRGDQTAGAPAVPFQSQRPEAQATQRATDAGGGGDRVMQAKATLNRAKSLDAEGNNAACMEAVAEARRQLEN